MSRTQTNNRELKSTRDTEIMWTEVKYTGHNQVFYHCNNNKISSDVLNPTTGIYWPSGYHHTARHEVKLPEFRVKNY